MTIQKLGDLILHSYEGEVRGDPKAGMLEFFIDPAWWNFGTVDRRVIPENAKLTRCDKDADVWKFRKDGQDVLIIIAEYEWFEKFIATNYPTHNRFHKSWLDTKRQYR